MIDPSFVGCVCCESHREICEHLGCRGLYLLILTTKEIDHLLDLESSQTFQLLLLADLIEVDAGFRESFEEEDALLD